MAFSLDHSLFPSFSLGSPFDCRIFVCFCALRHTRPYHGGLQQRRRRRRQRRQSLLLGLSSLSVFCRWGQTFYASIREKWRRREREKRDHYGALFPWTAFLSLFLSREPFVSIPFPFLPCSAFLPSFVMSPAGRGATWRIFPAAALPEPTSVACPDMMDAAADDRLSKMDGRLACEEPPH